MLPDDPRAAPGGLDRNSAKALIYQCLLHSQAALGAALSAGEITWAIGQESALWPEVADLCDELVVDGLLRIAVPALPARRRETLYAAVTADD